MPEDDARGMTKLYVRAPAGEDNSPARIAQADASIRTQGGRLTAKHGQPIQRSDGTYEVRADEDRVPYVKWALEIVHGLRVVGYLGPSQEVIDGTPLEDLLELNE
jgi:hypothetical protein